VAPLHITMDVDMDGVAILGPVGELDTDTGGDLADAITAVLTGHHVTHLVVDLARVSSLDTAALRTLLRARATSLQAGATFRVMRPRHPVRRVLHLTGTCQLLTCPPTPGRTSRV
jgi:anti-anti-sigma factor